MERHAQAQAPDLERACPDAPEPIRRFVARLMATDPEDRPSSAEQALEELKAAAEESLRAGGTNWWARSAVARFLKRIHLTGAWALVAVILVVITLIPPVVLYRERQRRKAMPADLLQQMGSKTLVLLSEPEGLPADEALAVRTLLAVGLGYLPDLEPADAAYGAKLRNAGTPRRQIAAQCGARYVLSASSETGFHRRLWTLSFASTEPRPWRAQAECPVDEQWRGDLTGLEGTQRELLRMVAGRLALNAADLALPLIDADGAAWVEVGHALQAERDGRWGDATARADRAAQLAPQAAAFALLSAFYHGLDALRKGPPGPPLNTFRREDLPRRMALMAGVLEGIVGDDAALAEERLADYLVQFPQSARGYYVLGAWLLHGAGRPDEALVALRHATRVDPGYMPAALVCVELLAERHPAKLDEFLADYRERALDKADADRLEAYAAERAGR